MGGSKSTSSKSAQQPPLIAERQKSAADAAALERLRVNTMPTGKEDSESGAIGTNLGGTGNSMDVGGGKAKLSNY